MYKNKKTRPAARTRIAGWPTDVREHAAWLASDGES